MKFHLFAICCLVALSVGACTQDQQAAAVNKLATPGGQVLCAVQAVGGPIALGLINAEATAALSSTGPGAIATPVALTANGMAKAQIDNLCSAAAAKIGGVSLGGTAAAPGQTATVTVAVHPSTGTVAP